MRDKRPEIILASGSPRRIEMLRAAGFAPRVIKPEVDETPRRGEGARSMVRRLAIAKARAVAQRVVGAGGSPTIIIAADTTVVAPDGRRILGKPRDPSDALRMLRLLSGRSHSVLTAYCVIAADADADAKRNPEIARVVASRVRMKKTSSDLLLEYVRTGEPMDKAGAYAIQGMGAILIESVWGSYTNVVGLPMAQLVSDLDERFGIRPCLGDAAALTSGGGQG